ncbi:MAG: DNA-binding transcriptional ArsR family regulator [Candidatus Azotimanducaceae bacterium]|jgi:DNA-binding transcriptional ArsR family regulator
MGQIKTEAYSLSQNRLAELIKAIAHPARIAILKQLIREDSCVCSGFVSNLQLAQATVSQHLKAMKEAGIIQGTIEGRNVCYCINPGVYEFLRMELNDLLRDLPQKAPNCC